VQNLQAAQRGELAVSALFPGLIPPDKRTGNKSGILNGPANFED